MGLTESLRFLRLRLPRPKAFLAFIPLDIGTELISFVLLFNKLTGVYGLLAILTGYSLSATQFTAYLYNLLIVILLAFCIPHIRRETPLPNLALAWAYGIDTLINAAYTAAFATNWFFASTAAEAKGSAPAASAASLTPSVAADATSAIAGTIASTAAFVPVATPTISPREDEIASAVTKVAQTVASAATAAVTAAAGATKNGTAQTAKQASSDEHGAGWMVAHETAASLTLIIIVTVVRFYFAFIVMAHTRRALQRYGDNVVDLSAYPTDSDEEDDDDDDEAKERKADRDEDDIDDEEAGLKSNSRRGRGRRRRQRAYEQSSSAGCSNNPFAPGSPAGEGWQGKVGRTLVKVGRGYWLGRQKDDWTRDVSAKFRSSGRRMASGSRL